MTKNETKIDDLLIEDYLAPESVFDRKRTKTAHFMWNTVFPNKGLMTSEYFVNAFLDDFKYEHHLIRPIFVLFSARSSDPRWTRVLAQLRTKDEYITEYYVGEDKDGKSLVMVVFQVPLKYADDYFYFRMGAYSKFSTAYKRTFARYEPGAKAIPGTESVVWGVIHKTPEIKAQLEAYFTARPSHPYTFDEEDELWGAPQTEYEVYRLPKKEKDGDSKEV